MGHPSLASFLRGSQDSVVGMVSMLWSGKVWNNGLIPDSSTRLFPSPDCPHHLWGPPNCLLNPLAPSDPYMGRTAQLTSRCCILNTYSTNIRTEYFKRAAYLRSFLFKMPFIS
jgi:hypothetical protein